MTHTYDIPQVTIRRARRPALIIFVGLVFLGLLIHHLDIVAAHHGDGLLVDIWTATFAISMVQLALAWRDTPRTVTPVQQRRLDRLSITVNIPVYNEDPQLLDRAIFALFSQTRLPDRIQVVDDGSATELFGDPRLLAVPPSTAA